MSDVEECGARAGDDSVEWVCNRPADHEGRHAYRTPNGESQVSWEKVARD